MGRLVSIDPGTRFTGYAWFEDKRLVDCGVLKAKGLYPMLIKCREYFKERETPLHYGMPLTIIEKPQVYTQRKMKGDANDLITIALVAGYCASFFEKSEFVLPRTWKGTVDKDMMCTRVQNRWMNERERELLESKRIPKSYVNNTLDAIGIGMHHLGRHR